MKINLHILWSMVGLILFVSGTDPTRASNLPHEPSERFLVKEDVNIMTGLYLREYSLAQNGVVDYKTARQIVWSEYNEYWNTVVYTMEFPLFYWYAADHDGHFAMWVDRKGDGCDCDIVPYQALATQR